MPNTHAKDAKQRIRQAALRLFSEKGFDAASVSEIAAAAKVNKALIYYYFPNKEAILDELVNLFFEGMTSLSLDFTQQHIVKMIRDGELDILPDRFRFVNGEALRRFEESTCEFCARQLDYLLANRPVVRILMLESLKNGKHRDALFLFFNLLRGTDDNPVFKALKKADADLQYTEGLVLQKFFFSSIPLIGFAAYYDRYKALTTLDDAQLREEFLRFAALQGRAAIEGQDVLLQPPLPFPLPEAPPPGA